ncbi:receptor binding protein [Jeilongvirus chaetodipodis]|uniref:Receptor binding protein n=1 Tax=Paramyxoviridae sp. TaxID=1663356 RepID=A0AC61TNV7_9MONO|nr:receptor binding protein [Paramyxoviridae sp.]
MDFYKDQSTVHNISETNTPNKEVSLTKVCNFLLNLTCLILLVIVLLFGVYLYKNRDKSISNEIGLLSDILNNLDDVYLYLTKELLPKVNLINVMVTYTLPSKIQQAEFNIINKFRHHTPLIPSIDPFPDLCSTRISHSHYVSLLNQESISSCINSGRTLVFPTGINLADFPSFVPGSTHPDGCIRNPSYSLDETTFAYTHKIHHNGCSEAGTMDQYLNIGVILDQGGPIPFPKIVQQWYISDNIKRKQCSVATSLDGAWLFCVINNGIVDDDQCNSNPKIFSLAFLSNEGDKREWLINGVDVNFDFEYTRLDVATGSGVSLGGFVYFLVYGSIQNPINEDSYCSAPGCATVTQQACNNGQRPSWYCNKQQLNGIASFNLNFSTKPDIKVTTISPRLINFGSNGRLIKGLDSSRVYLYLESSSWYALPRTGIITLYPVITIQWIFQGGVSRPGNERCNALHRCPADCVTGYYTDLYPLSEDYDVSATVYLNSLSAPQNPYIAVADTSRVIEYKKIFDGKKTCSYSTTTCFEFKGVIWCVSVIVISPGSITENDIVPILYRVDQGCKDIDTDSHRIVRPTKSKILVNTAKRLNDIGVSKEKGFLIWTNMTDVPVVPLKFNASVVSTSEGLKIVVNDIHGPLGVPVMLSKDLQNTINLAHPIVSPPTVASSQPVYLSQTPTAVTPVSSGHGITIVSDDEDLVSVTNGSISPTLMSVPMSNAVTGNVVSRRKRSTGDNLDQFVENQTKREFPLMRHNLSSSYDYYDYWMYWFEKYPGLFDYYYDDYYSEESTVKGNVDDGLVTPMNETAPEKVIQGNHYENHLIGNSSYEELVNVTPTDPEKNIIYITSTISPRSVIPTTSAVLQITQSESSQTTTIRPNSAKRLTKQDYKRIWEKMARYRKMMRGLR